MGSLTLAPIIMRIRCVHRKKGCDWVEHIECCCYEEAECTNYGYLSRDDELCKTDDKHICRLDSSMSGTYLANHQKECEYHQYTCEYCGYVDTYDAIASTRNVGNEVLPRCDNHM